MTALLLFRESLGALIKRFEIPQLAKLIFVAACALLPVQALGQAPPKVARVGVFHIGDEASLAKYTEAFIAGMTARGYTVGKNLVLIASIEDPEVIARILSYLERTASGQEPPQSPLGARAPPSQPKLL